MKGKITKHTAKKRANGQLFSSWSETKLSPNQHFRYRQGDVHIIIIE